MKAKTFIILLLIAIPLVGIANDFYPEKLAEKMIKIVLKDKNILLDEKVEIDNICGKKESLVVYRFTNQEDKKEMYAVFTQSKGRYEFFDYLLVTTPDFEIEKVSILKYRSEHGGEIASKKWLSQFEKYSGGDLHYKKEISALSGATISANSLVDDVLKVLEILRKNCN